MKRASIFGGILILVLFVAVAAALSLNAPSLTEEMGPPRDTEPTFSVIENAVITVVDTNLYVTVADGMHKPNTSKWKIKCKIQGQEAMLTMPSHGDRSRPDSLAIGRTYKIAYICSGSPKHGRILRVYGGGK